jgi:hypothetical protein
MFDTKSMQMIRTIDPNADNPSANPRFSGDGIYVDASNHPLAGSADGAAFDPRTSRRPGTGLVHDPGDREVVPHANHA